MQTRGQPRMFFLPPGDSTRADAVMACQDNMDFMAGLPDGSMNLVVTSKPYNLGKLYEKRTRLESYVRGQARVIAECVRLNVERRPAAR